MKKKIITKCPYKYKDFERCPNTQCRVVLLYKGQKKCDKCNKDVKASYIKNVNNGIFA